ncbi:MAG: hypothetical protein JO295_01320 [Verrucomicrobia bacterium]|nr:hypothetical protein [Verrucomicrobiota bacterium]
MSALAEIEEALDQLPSAQQAALFAFHAEWLRRQDSAIDPVAEVIGAFSGGEPNDTGRRVKEILYGHDEAKRCHPFSSTPAPSIRWPTAETSIMPPCDLLEANWERCQRFADKEWDWVDRVSFELMERRGAREAFSIERHFAQVGFTLLVQ